MYTLEQESRKDEGTGSNYEIMHFCGSRSSSGDGVELAAAVDSFGFSGAWLLAGVLSAGCSVLTGSSSTRLRRTSGLDAVEARRVGMARGPALEGARRRGDSAPVSGSSRVASRSSRCVGNDRANFV